MTCCPQVAVLAGGCYQHCFICLGCTGSDERPGPAADVLLKVSASPYLLLLDLFEEVESAATTATVSETHITFTLQKVSTLMCAPCEVPLRGAWHATVFPDSAT